MISAETRKYGNAVFGVYEAISGLWKIDRAADRRIQDINSGSFFTSLTSYQYNGVTVLEVQTDLANRKTEYIKKHNVVEKAAALEGYRGKVVGAARMLTDLYGLDTNLEEKVEEYIIASKKR